MNNYLARRNALQKKNVVLRISKMELIEEIEVDLVFYSFFC
jgi:hypothetical protein